MFTFPAGEFVLVVYVSDEGTRASGPGDLPPGLRRTTPPFASALPPAGGSAQRRYFITSCNLVCIVHLILLSHKNRIRFQYAI